MSDDLELRQRLAAARAGVSLQETFGKQEPPAEAVAGAPFDKARHAAELHDSRMRSIGFVLLPYLRRQCAQGWPGHGQFSGALTNALDDLEIEVHEHGKAARVIAFPVVATEPHVHESVPDETCFCTEGA